MQGRLSAIAGALLVGAGGVGLYFAYEAQGFALAALCWAALLLGAFLLVSGLSRFFADFMAPQKSVESTYSETETRIFIQCLGAMASADGKISSEEIAIIASIHDRMLGLAIPRERISKILEDFTPSFDIRAKLGAERDKVSPAMRERIIKSCFLVMMSDRVEEKSETGKIHEIGRALGYSDEDTDDLIAMAGV